MYDVIISGYYGFENSGDDAILTAIIDNLRKKKNDIKIVVLSKTPKKTTELFGVDSVDRFNMFQVLRTIKSSKLFLNGGGNLIQDITSTRSLMYYLSTIYAAKLFGLKVMLYANGIGPINKGRNKRLTKHIINKVDMITLREEASRCELDGLGIKKPKIVVTADPALSLKPSEDEEIDKLLAREGIEPGVPLVGFSIRKWKGYEDYSSTIAELADYIIEKYNVRPVFIPMQFPNDLPVSEDIASKMKGKAYIIRNKYSVPDMLGIIKRMEIMMGMRLHALIYATSLVVPVIGFIYDPKVEGFLEYVNQPSAGLVSELKLENLKPMVDEVWSNKSQIRQQLERTNELLKRRAVENAELAISLLEKN